jgi:hypothetical protein
MNLMITQNNAAALKQYSDLVGVSPQEFLNRFLAQFLLNRFSDPDIGEAEPFLLGFTFKDPATAERLVGWI